VRDVNRGIFPDFPTGEQSVVEKRLVGPVVVDAFAGAIRNRQLRSMSAYPTAQRVSAPLGSRVIACTGRS
jgi:hypothetical protein